MKSILYILAIAVIGGAAFFTFKNIEVHQAELDKTTRVEGENKKLQKNISDENDKIRHQKGLRDTAQVLKDEQEAQVRLNEGIRKEHIEESALYDDDINKLAAEKANNDAVLAAIIALVKDVDENLTLEGVPDHFNKLKNERKEKYATLGLLEDDVADNEKRVAENRARIADLHSTRDKRRKNLKSNGVSSLITTVDSDWGFVVIKPHPDAIIKQDSKLIVIRGNNHIGRLSINSIEGGRVLANIDYKSLVAGMKIRAGDRVILSKSVTN